MEKTSHDGDCTIFAAVWNGTPVDGICTCGYGWSLVRNGDWSEMYSEQRLAVYEVRQKLRQFDQSN